MSHTLVSYIFNIFSIFVKMAKNPHVVRKFKITNIIDEKEAKIGQIMYKSLLDQLQLCSTTSSLWNLFTNPASSYYLFFSKNIYNINNKRPFVDDRRNPSADKPQDGVCKLKKRVGSIINTTGERILFPKGLEKRYCADFLDVGKSCKHGETCCFAHALFPCGFTPANRDLIIKHVSDIDGLYFKDKNVSNIICELDTA